MLVDDTYHFMGRFVMDVVIEDNAITYMELDDGTRLTWRAYVTEDGERLQGDEVECWIETEVE